MINDKIKTKALVIISALLLCSLLTNGYFLFKPTTTDTGRYEELYKISRETIDVMRENHKLLGKDIDELGKLQEQFTALQQSYNKLNAERITETARRAKLEKGATRINSRMGSEISEGIGLIEQGRAEQKRLEAEYKGQ